MQQNPVTSRQDSVVDLMVTAGKLTRLAGVIGGAVLPRAVMRALAVLDEHGALRVSAFARIDGCSQPAATALIGRLVAQGYASRSKDPEDSRAVVVEITPAGRDRLRQARHAFGAAFADRLSGFDAERLHRIDKDLKDLLDALNEADSPSAPIDTEVIA